MESSSACTRLSPCRAPARGESLRLFALFALAFLLRLGLCAVVGSLGQSPAGHYREYVTVGQRFLTEGTLTTPLVTKEITNAPSSLMPPAYAVLVAGVYRLFGVETTAATVALQTINALATALASIMVFLVARRLGGRTAGWLAAVIAAANPTLIGFSGVIWDVDLFVLGTVLVTWVAVRQSEQPAGWWARFGLGVLLGGLALLNPALTACYPLLVLWSITRCGRKKSLYRVAGTVAVVVLGWLVVITPWTIRNYRAFDKLIYIRGGFMLNLWQGVCPEADTQPSEMFLRQYPLGSSREQQKVIAIGEQEYFKLQERHARAAIAADPGRYARLFAIRAVDFWLGTTFSHTPPGGSGWPTSPARQTVTIFLSVECLLIVLTLLLVRRPGPDVWWLIGMALAFSVVYCLTHVMVRYRAPCEPFIAIIIALLIARVFRSRTAAGSEERRPPQPE